MPRLAVLTVALSLAFAAVTGTIALTRTLDLGQAAAKPSVSSRALAKRTAQLNAFEASLHAQLERRPPRVPKLPPAPTPSAAPTAAAAPAVPPAPQRVVYVRPAPIVIHKHRAGGVGADHGDGGGGLDD
jgi:hypothetical protein